MSDVSLSRISGWFAQGIGAWVFVMATPVGLGALLSLGIPGRHRMAKLGGLKWSLYLSVLQCVVVAGWHGYISIAPPVMPAPTPKQPVISDILPTRQNYGRSKADPPAALFAGVYGLWWAAGTASHRYNRTRRLRAFLAYALIFSATWALVAKILFPVGPLESLL